MQTLINFILAILKWPLALLMFFLIIPVFKTDMMILYNGLTLDVLGWFFLPLLVMILVWLIIPGLSGSFLSILEHELTHMVFAILTFQSPHDINVQRGVGGNFIYTGKGNWLISLAPYFFPTSSAIVILLGVFYPLMGQVLPSFYWAILGVMTGYHLISTLDEIHLGQTDFKSAGYLFSILFLPGANLCLYGFLLSFACYGFQGFGLFFDLAVEEIILFFKIFF